MLTRLTLLLTLIFSVNALADSREEIDALSDEALTKFYAHTDAGKALAKKAKGILIFPKVYKGGFGIGGEYGEGKLIVEGKTKGYYSISAASIGLQFGVQKKSQLTLFMTQEALDTFVGSDGWEAGVDGSVALATLGAGGEIDTQTAKQPVIGFIFSNKGLMYNLTFEGSKISKIDR